MPCRYIKICDTPCEVDKPDVEDECIVDSEGEDIEDDFPEDEWGESPMKLQKLSCPECPKCPVCPVIEPVSPTDLFSDPEYVPEDFFLRKRVDVEENEDDDVALAPPATNPPSSSSQFSPTFSAAGKPSSECIQQNTSSSVQHDPDSITSITPALS